MTVLKKYMEVIGAKEIKMSTYYIPRKESQDQSSGLNISLSKCDISTYLPLKIVLHVILVDGSSQVLFTYCCLFFFCLYQIANGFSNTSPRYFEAGIKVCN